MRRNGINIARGDVGFDFVFVQTRARRGMINGIQQREQLPGALAIAEQCEGDHRPDCPVRILTAVLTHTGNVALDVTRIEIAPVERRRKENHQSIAASDQVLIDGVHCANGPIVLRGARDDRPRLRD